MKNQVWSLLNFSQYAAIILVAVPCLLDIGLSTPRGWIVLALVILLGLMTIFYNQERLNSQFFLWSEVVLIVVLLHFNPFFMILGFNLAAHASISLPFQQAIRPIIVMVIFAAIDMIYYQGWATGLFYTVSAMFGFFSFASFNFLRRHSEESHRETQRLLDELREAHHQLEVYAEQVQELAIVEERNRLARELHDSVKQQAFAVSAQLAAARSLLQREPAAVEDHLVKAEALMDDIRRELAQLIHELRPAALQDRGLAAALREWGAEWSRQAGISLDVQVTGERWLPVEAEQALFRIVQEALSNVARHSQASTVEVSLEYHPSFIILTICDNGQGFDLNHPHDGLGLRSMRERAEHLAGGQFQLQSAPGSGTRIEVRCLG